MSLVPGAIALSVLRSRHTFHQFQKQGYEAKPVDLQVSFGKGDKVCASRLTVGPR